ncbi:unnamed protein product, partial [Mesorhabditis spiculigera]
MFKEFATKNRMLATICTLQTREQAVFQRLFHLFGGCPGCKVMRNHQEIEVETPLSSEQAVFQRLFHLFGGCPGCKNKRSSSDYFICSAAAPGAR